MQVDATILNGLVPLNALHPEHRGELASSAVVLELAQGEPLGADADDASRILYLLDGEMALRSGSRTLESVAAGTPAANYPLAPAAEHGPQWHARAASRLLRIDGSLVSSLLIWMQSATGVDAAEARHTLYDSQTARWVYRLLGSPLFARIPSANIRRILEILEPVRVRAGDVVVRQGDPGNFYYVIRSGKCEVTRPAARGGEPLRLATLAEGDTFGEEALVADARRNATITMLTGGSLMRLTKTDFLELIREPVVSTVPWQQAERLGDEGACWLDVRLAEEHAHYAIDGSYNIPLAALRERLGELDREATYIVYSNTGRRSAAGAFVLTESGLRAYSLDKGLARGKDPAPFRPPAQAPAAAGPASAPHGAADLKAALAKANAELERAIQDKCEATAARRYWSHPERQDDVARKPDLRTHIKMLEMRSATASKTLADAQRRKLEIEAAMRRAEAEAARHRAEAESACERLRSQTEERLQTEELRLQAEYARAAETIEQLKTARHDAERRVQEERKRIEEDFARSQHELSEAARRVRADMETAKQAAAERAERIRREHDQEEARLREETEAKLMEERKRLEAEFVESVARLEKARQALEHAEAERQRAEQDAASLSQELREADVQRRARTEARFTQERERLDAAARSAQDALSAARSAARDAADPSQHEAAVEKAEQAVADVQRERAHLEDRFAEARAAEEELRVKLLEEAEAFARQERNESEAEVRRLTGGLEVVAEAAATAPAPAPAPDELPEIEAAAGSDDTARGRLAFASERVMLTRWAEDQARQERLKAKEALDRAREHIAQLKRKAGDAG